MTLVRVKGFWLNPAMVVSVYHEEMAALRDTPAYWRVILRCEEGQVWYFKHPTEEDAVRDADKIAEQINEPPRYVPPPDVDARPGGLR